MKVYRLSLLLIVLIFPLLPVFSQSNQSGQIRIYVNSQEFQGSYFVENHDIYMQLVPFVNALNLQRVAFFTKDLTETESGKILVSLEGAASSLGAQVTINWEKGRADFSVSNIETMRNRGMFSMYGGSEEHPKLTIRVNNQPFPGDYFVENNDLYIELMPFVKILDIPEVTFFTRDLLEIESGKTFVSLQGAASSLGGTAGINFQTGTASFYLSSAAFPYNKQIPPEYEEYYNYYYPYNAFNYYPFGYNPYFGYSYFPYSPYYYSGCYDWFYGCGFVNQIFILQPNVQAPLPSPPPSSTGGIVTPKPRLGITRGIPEPPRVIFSSPSQGNRAPGEARPPLTPPRQNNTQGDKGTVTRIIFPVQRAPDETSRSREQQQTQQPAPPPERNPGQHVAPPSQPPQHVAPPSSGGFRGNAPVYHGGESGGSHGGGGSSSSQKH